MFDRGHLTSFDDARWGTEPLRNGLDTFFFTNCAPQSVAFNEHAVWRRIESWAALKGDEGRVLIFNGPIFDGPRSTRLSNGERKLQPDNSRVPDPILQGVAIPKQYFKIVVYREGDRLAAQAFVVTQESYLEDFGLERREVAQPTPQQLSLYRVPLAVVSRMASVDFDPLAAQVRQVNQLLEDPPQIIRSMDDLDR